MSHIFKIVIALAIPSFAYAMNHNQQTAPNTLAGQDLALIMACAKKDIATLNELVQLAQAIVDAKDVCSIRRARLNYQREAKAVYCSLYNLDITLPDSFQESYYKALENYTTTFCQILSNLESTRACLVTQHSINLAHQLIETVMSKFYATLFHPMLATQITALALMNHQRLGKNTAAQRQRALLPEDILRSINNLLHEDAGLHPEDYQN